MATNSHWAVYYHNERQEFREMRQLSRQVLSRSGQIKTGGYGVVQRYGTPEAAADAFAAECQKVEGQGYVLGFETHYDPASLNVELLGKLLGEGIRQSLAAWRAENPGELLQGFALLTDGSRMTIGSVATSHEALERDGGGEDARWNACEWSIHDEGAAFDRAYRLILPMHQEELPMTLDFDEFVRAFDETCVRTLHAMAAEGCFGAEGKEFLSLQASDSPFDVDSIKELNSETIWQQFMKWHDSWN